MVSQSMRKASAKQVGFPNKYRYNSHDHTIRDLLCLLCPLCPFCIPTISGLNTFGSHHNDMCPLHCDVPTLESWPLYLRQLAMHIKSSSHILIFSTFQPHRQ